MIIRVAHRSKNFTVIANQPIRDVRLSFRARGILVYLLSFTHDARISGRSLTAVTNETLRAILAALDELETAGYLTREKTQDSRGRWRTECVVREIPESKMSLYRDSLDSKVSRLPRLGDPVPKYEVHRSRPAYDGPCAFCPEPATTEQHGKWVCAEHGEAP